RGLHRDQALGGVLECPHRGQQGVADAAGGVDVAGVDGVEHLVELPADQVRHDADGTDLAGRVGGQVDVVDAVVVRQSGLHPLALRVVDALGGVLDGDDARVGGQLDDGVAFQLPGAARRYVVQHDRQLRRVGQ